MEQSKDKLWDPLTPVVSHTDMPRPEDFPSHASLVFDTSFIPNDPVPDVEVSIPNVVPFMCHKERLCSSALYKGEFAEYPETAVFYPSSIYEDNPLSVIYYLYTNRLTANASRPNTSFVQQCIELSITAHMEHDLDDLQRQAQNALLLFCPNGISSVMSIKAFIWLVYEFKGGLDYDFRTRLIRPHIREYIKLLIEELDGGDIESFPMMSVAKLMADVIAWQGVKTQVVNATVLLQVLRGFAATVPPVSGSDGLPEQQAEHGIEEALEMNREHGVDEVAEILGGGVYCQLDRHG